MANRVLAAIKRRKVMFEKRAAEGNPVTNDFDLTYEEHLAFYNAQAEAHASGIITSEEAQTICGLIGEVGPENFNLQPLHVKMALAKVFHELMAWKIALARASQG